uniref:DRBM domain-containing protein n=1 Tax=Araucaria cunninghamii TaxID=56994 RepID=A0A0D6R5C0_ARACU
MYKNQLQELAQRSCFNLPAYSCIREGPDHAPRFKATVNFNGEVFESPNYCSTLRQAEHAAAEVALNTLSKRGPSQSLAARILDETGVYKNLLQEIAQRAGAPLPVYTTVRSGLGHLPVFTCTVELAGIKFTGEPAKNKKQAEKNAAMAAWSSLRQLPHQSGFSSQSSGEGDCNEGQEHITIARALASHRHKEVALSQQMKQQQSITRRRMLAQRENSGHSIRETSSHSNEHQHFVGGGSQWVSSDLLSEGCSRFSPSHNQHHQHKLHLPAPPSSGSKILPFIRSILPQRSRSGSLHDSPSASSMSREAIAANRAAAATASVGNSLNESLPLALAREAIGAKRSGVNIRTVHRPISQQVTSQEVSISLEEHDRDEEEWLRGDLPRESNAPTLGISNLADWASAFGSTNSLPWPNSAQSWNMQRHQQQQQQQHHLMPQTIPQPVSSFGASRCRVSPSSMVAAPVRIRTSIPVCAAPPQRRPHSEFLNSEFLSHDNNLVPSPMHPAPAVRVRSVIPVCSAPPPRRSLSQDQNKSSVDQEDSTLELLNQLRL